MGSAAEIHVWLAFSWTLEMKVLVGKRMLVN